MLLFAVLSVLCRLSVCQNFWWLNVLRQNGTPWAESTVKATARDLNSTGQVETDKKCECVMYYLCDPDTGIIKTTGSGLIDWRLGENCANKLEICCLVPLNEEKVIIPNPLPNSVPIDYFERNEVTKKPESDLKCGVRRPVVEWRAVNSTGQSKTSKSDTEFAEFPWMLGLNILKPDGDDLVEAFRCGASLIHPQVAMTAAHCLDGVENHKMILRAGEWDLQSTDEPLPHQIQTVSSFEIHPEFNKVNPKNDIALLFLDAPFTMENNINFVCLPETGENYQKNNCFAAGWGTSSADEKTAERILKKVELPIVSKEECQIRLRKTRLGKYFKLDESFICAGGDDGQDTCYGDGGGPLTCSVEGDGGRHVQVGITSWGIGCGDNNIPGVYVDVALFRSWIDEVLKKKNIDF